MMSPNEKKECVKQRFILATATFLTLFAIYSLARESLCPFNADHERACWRLTGDEPAYLLTAQAIASGKGEDVSSVHAAKTYTNYWYEYKWIIGNTQWTYDNCRERYGVRFRFDRREQWGNQQILHGGPLEPILCSPFALSQNRPRWKVLLVQGLLAALAGATLVMLSPGGRRAAVLQAASTVFILGSAPVMFYTAQIYPETIMGVLLALFLLLVRREGAVPRCIGHACLFLALFGSSRIAGAAFVAAAICLARAICRRQWGEVVVILLGASAYFGYHIWRWGNYFPPNTDANSPITPSLLPRGFVRYLFGNSCGVVPMCPAAWAGLLVLIPLLSRWRTEQMALPCAVLSMGIAMSVAMFPTFRGGTCAAGRYQVACVWALLPAILVFVGIGPEDSRWGRRIRFLLWTLGPLTIALSIWLAIHPRRWFEHFHPFFKPVPLQRFYVLLPDFSGVWRRPFALMISLLCALTFIPDVAMCRRNTKASQT